jgi:hypothetical protein
MENSNNSTVNSLEAPATKNETEPEPVIDDTYSAEQAREMVAKLAAHTLKRMP